MPTLSEVTVTAINPNHAKNEEDLRYIRGINKMRNYAILHGYTDLQWADLSKFVYNVAAQESQHGESIRYKVKLALGENGIQFLKKYFRDKMTVPSKGVALMKYPSSKSDLYKKFQLFGITPSNLEFKNGQAAILRAIDNDNRHQGLRWKDTKLPMSREDYRVISWNRGNVTDTLNTRTAWHELPLTKNIGGTYLTRYYNNKEIW